MPAGRRISLTLSDSRDIDVGGYKGDLPLLSEYGYVVQNWSPGFPEVRDNSDKRPQMNGTLDNTEFFGARPVVAVVALAPELIRVEDRMGMTDHDLELEIRGWMMPSLRPWIRWSRDSEPSLRMKVRAANVGSNMNLKRYEFHMLTLSWRAPEGVSESDTQEQVTLQPGVTTSETGRSYNLTFDRSYPASSVIGLKDANNSGNAPVYPVITFFGPMTQPRIENVTTGKKLEFLSSYVLNAGEYLVVDFREGTALLGGSVSNSRYDKIDFSVSDWWELIPGENLLRLYPNSYSSPASALVEYRSAYI